MTPDKQSDTPECDFCGLPLIYGDSTSCPNGCNNRPPEWKEIRLLRNEIRDYQSTTKELTSLKKDIEALPCYIPNHCYKSIEIYKCRVCQLKQKLNT